MGAGLLSRAVRKTWGPCARPIRAGSVNSGPHKRYLLKDPGFFDLRGVRTLSSKLDTLGPAPIAAKGKFGDYQVDPDDLPATVIVGLRAPRGDDGRCASATFGTPPGPSCIYDGTRGKLTCR